MTALVVDASVVIKWFLPEIRSDAAQQLLYTDNHFFAPDLLFAELGNVLWKKVGRGQLTEEDGKRLANDVVGIDVETVPTRLLLADSYALAVAIRCTVYDALYLALAGRLGTACVTADERLCDAVTRMPAIRHLVRLLG
jgi:predicted nucleic acid-binding protein